jgi:two-component system alkaline phosphatase synthesis response regulator PhoP
MPPFAHKGRLVYTYNFPGEVASFGDVRVDFARMELVRNGDGVQLTATEFKLLAFLLQNPERVISRKEFLDTIWGYPTDSATRTVDIHISKLRQKLERDPANPIHLRTVHCSGYKFVP